MHAETTVRKTVRLAEVDQSKTAKKMQPHRMGPPDSGHTRKSGETQVSQPQQKESCKHKPHNAHEAVGHSLQRQPCSRQGKTTMRRKDASHSKRGGYQSVQCPPSSGTFTPTAAMRQPIQNNKVMRLESCDAFEPISQQGHAT